MDVVVGGFDIAHINTGVTFVRGVVEDASIRFELLAEKPFQAKNVFLSRFHVAKFMVRDSLTVKEKFGLHLCVMEEYLNVTQSNVAFSMGEMGGICRAMHYAAGFPVMLNVPGRIRSFIADGRKIPKGDLGKKALMQWTTEDFGFESKCLHWKERSDCSDAYLHAVIGIYVIFFMRGIVPLSVLSAKRQQIFKNRNYNGILDTPRRYIFPALPEGERWNVNP